MGRWEFRTKIRCVIVLVIVFSFLKVIMIIFLVIL